jgi:hypothetical protein
VAGRAVAARDGAWARLARLHCATGATVLRSTGPRSRVIESWIDSPVLGDMAVVTTYSDYKDYGGVKLPSRILQSMGGFPVLDLMVTEPKVNVASVAVPSTIARAVIEVAVDKAAEGVWVPARRVASQHRHRNA